MRIHRILFMTKVYEAIGLNVFPLELMRSSPNNGVNFIPTKLAMFILRFR